MEDILQEHLWISAGACELVMEDVKALWSVLCRTPARGD